MALTRDLSAQAEGESSVLPAKTTAGADGGLLCGWKNDNIIINNPTTDRGSVTSPRLSTGSNNSLDITNSKQGDSQLLCGWKHSPVGSKKPVRPEAQTPTSCTANMLASTDTLPDPPLVCEWNHDNLKPTAASREKSLDRTDSNSLEDTELLCGWNQKPGEKHTKNPAKPTMLRRRASSEPDLMADSSREDEEEEDGGFFSRVGSSMRNLFADPQESPRVAASAWKGRPERIDRKKLHMRKALSIDSGSGHSSASNHNNNNNNNGEDGVVTYMGKQYSANELFERCNNSVRTMYSNNDSNATLSSFEEGEDEDEDGSDEETSSIVGRFLIRGLSSLKLAPAQADDTRSLGSHKLRRRKEAQRSRSYAGFQHAHKPLRSLSPKGGRGENYQWGDKSSSRNRSKSPPSSRAVLMKQRSMRSMSAGRATGQQLLNPDDVLDLAENPQDFAALKRSLKNHKAITNGMLQQGLHIYVHQQKLQKQERQRREKKRERARSRERASSKERGPARIPRPQSRTCSRERGMPTKPRSRTCSREKMPSRPRSRTCSRERNPSGSRSRERTPPSRSRSQDDLSPARRALTAS